MNTLFIPFFASAGLMAIIFGLALWDILSKYSLKVLPKVSFIVPAYNSYKFINETTDSLFSQNYPKNKIEVIVFASGPNLDKYDFKRYKKNFVFIKGKGKVEKAVAVNKAAKKCKNDFFFVVDSDTILDKNCLKKVIVRFENEKVGAVTAARTAKNTGFWSIMQNFEYVMTNIILTSYNKLGSTVGIHGCAMAFRKKAFNDINGIARVPAQDFDAALRLIEKKWKVICETRGVSITITPNFFQWITQRFRWMRGFSLSLLNHYKVFFTEPFGLFFSVIYGLLSVIFIANLFVNKGFTWTIFYLLLTMISFKLPILFAVAFFTGFMGWAVLDRFLLLILYSCLSIPYAAYPYKKWAWLKIFLIFAYSFVYMPLFSITGIIGFLMALNDKIRGRKVIKW